MTWFPMYRQPAMNMAGQMVESAQNLQAFDVNDTDFSDPLPVRALASPPGAGTGALLPTVAVQGYASIAFEVERDHVYLRSGNASPILVTSWQAAIKHRGDYVPGAAYDVNDLFDVGGVTYRTLQRFTAAATAPTGNTAQYKEMGAAAGELTDLEAGAGIGLAVVGGKLRITATGAAGSLAAGTGVQIETVNGVTTISAPGAGSVDTTTLAPKSELRRPVERTGVNIDGPWPTGAAASRVGWKAIEWIGAAPDPVDMQAGDIRTEPV